MKRLLYNTSSLDIMELCQKLAKEQLALVSVELASPTFLKSVTNRRVSFIDRVSTLGKLLKITLLRHNILSRFFSDF